MPTYSNDVRFSTMKEKTARAGLVSVIVPTYNRAHLIVATLDSIFQQTYRPIELIVVDDGSCDRTADIVRDWMKKKGEQDSGFSVRYIRQDNRGPSAARNRGLCECSGEFIQFLDSDDVLHQQKFSLQISALKRNSAGFCVCNYQSFVEDLSELGPVADFFSRSHSFDDFPSEYPMHIAALLLQREVVQANGPWHEYLSAGEDFEYNFRIVARGANGIWLNEVLLYVRKHGGPERIQNNPLSMRYRSMYIGLAKMEMEAIERGVCSKKLLNSLGIRAHQYYRHTKAEGSLAQADIFLRYACPRLFWTSRVTIFAKRVLPVPVIKVCVAAKRILRGGRR